MSLSPGGAVFGIDHWLWIRRLAVTAAAAATLPYLTLPRVPATDLPMILDLVSRARGPLTPLVLVSFLILAVVLVWSKAETGARDLSVFLSGTGLTVAVWVHVRMNNASVVEGMFGLPNPTAIGGVLLASWTLACAAMMRFSVTFPRQASAADMHRAFWFGSRPLPDTPPAFTRGVWWLFQNAWPVGASVSAFLILASWIGGELLVGAALLFMWAFTNLPLMAALALLPRIHRTGDERTRRQTFWVALGVTWGLIFLPMLATWGTGLPVLVFPGPATQAWSAAGGIVGTGVAIGGLVFVLCLAVALFKDGIFDPRFVLGRSVVYGGTLFFLVFLFAVLEEVIQSLVLDRIGVASNLSTWLAGAGAAVVFGPLRSRCEKFMTAWLGDASISDRTSHVT